MQEVDPLKKHDKNSKQQTNLLPLAKKHFFYCYTN